MKEHAVRGMIEARGLVFPDDGDGACFRCGGPGALSAGELGICLDREDQITLMAELGDDVPLEKIADDFASGRWFVSCGANAWVRSLVPEIKKDAGPPEYWDTEGLPTASLPWHQRSTTPIWVAAALNLALAIWFVVADKPWFLLMPAAATVPLAIA